MARKKVPARLNPRNYPKPTRWFSGYRSRAQVKKFERTAKLRKYAQGMLANTPGGNTKASRVNKLPYRVGRRR